MTRACGWMAAHSVSAPEPGKAHRDRAHTTSRGSGACSRPAAARTRCWMPLAGRALARSSSPRPWKRGVPPLGLWWQLWVHSAAHTLQACRRAPRLRGARAGLAQGSPCARRARAGLAQAALRAQGSSLARARLAQGSREAREPCASLARALREPCASLAGARLAQGEPCGRKARALREPCAKYKSRCGCSRFRCLFSSFGEEHELVARNHSKKNEQKTSEP